MARGYRETLDRPRRFYKAVAVGEGGGGFVVRLDGREVRTPGGNLLRLPTRTLAKLVAEEWAGQGEWLQMAEMHATRLANTAVDSIPGARQATAQAVAGYAGTDLTCYFADAPRALRDRQAAAWEPVLGRVEADLACRFVRASGIVHATQPDETLSRVEAEALAQEDFNLAGLAFGASLFGSAVLALSLQRGWLDGAQAFELSRLDEAWQEGQWGVDAEAAERTARLLVEATMLERWFRALS